MHQHEERRLADDLLPSIGAIAHYLGKKERQVRHLIAVKGLPHTKRGGRLESRKSWLDAYYAEPDSGRDAA